jgi:hypothetical protein
MPPLADVMLTRESTIARGAYGYLGKALERYIRSTRLSC